MLQKDTLKNNRLSKQERLSATKSIDLLFTSGKSFMSYPLRVVYIQKANNSISPTQPPAILTSVSKKRFKRAVKRNRIKRLIREAYRLNKQSFIANTNNQIEHIAFIYVKNTLPTYVEIENAMLKAAEIMATQTKSNSI